MGTSLGGYCKRYWARGSRFPPPPELRHEPTPKQPLCNCALEVFGTQSVKFRHLNTAITCFDLPANERLGAQIHYINRVPLNQGPASVFDTTSTTT